MSFPTMFRCGQCGEAITGLVKCDTHCPHGPRIPELAVSENRREPAAICGMCETPVDCASQARCKIPRLKETPPSGETPRTDRETYTIKPADVGFTAISPSLGKILERELADSVAEVAHYKLLATMQRENQEHAEAALYKAQHDLARQVEAEREACAKVAKVAAFDCLQKRLSDGYHSAVAIEEAIRARATGKGGEKQ